MHGTWIVVMLAVTGLATAAFAIHTPGEPRQFIQLERQAEMPRVLQLETIVTQSGPAKIWICSDSDCAEGCCSKSPNRFGNSLILEESRQLTE